ncbi:MAG: hypothetical protein IT375_05220 [Polyangiaceae bacterium]|nr:hypothetical protein [Polyangiaceae bacterium]
MGFVVNVGTVRFARIPFVGALALGLGSSCDDEAVAGRPDAGAAGVAGLGGGGGAPSGGGGGSGGSAGAPDSSTDADGPVEACAAEQATVIAFVKANKGCAADTDCVFVKAESRVQELCPSPHYAGGFYLNAAHDKAEYAKLTSTLDACLPPLPPCNMSAFPAVCWHGQCESNLDLAFKTQCLSDFGGESACTKCACALCSNWCWDVLANPVILCAIKAGCLGTPKCDPASPDFPCKEALAETGGGSYQLCNDCIADWQCTADCAAGE